MKTNIPLPKYMNTCLNILAVEIISGQITSTLRKFNFISFFY